MATFKRGGCAYNYVYTYILQNGGRGPVYEGVSQGSIMSRATFDSGGPFEKVAKRARSVLTDATGTEPAQNVVFTCTQNYTHTMPTTYMYTLVRKQLLQHFVEARAITYVSCNRA